MIYLNDHPPAHVHVGHAGKEARIGLDPVESLHNYGFNSRELNEILRVIADNQDMLLEKWDTIHSER